MDLPVFEGYQPHLPRFIVAPDQGAQDVLGAAPVLFQLPIPHYHVCIFSHCIEQWPGRKDEVAACAAVAATASSRREGEPSASRF